jgi:hypothetical protein
MGYGIAFRTYHNRVVKKDLTPKLSSFTTPMVEEVNAAFDEIIGKPKGCSKFNIPNVLWLIDMTDFVPISFYNTIAMSVARVSSRLFVGKDFGKKRGLFKSAKLILEQLRTHHTCKMRWTMPKQWSCLLKLFASFQSL